MLRKNFDGYYDKEGKKIGVYEYRKLFVDKDYKIVKQDTVGDFLFSTVWLGIDHAYGEGSPIIFETMIFNEKDTDWEDSYQERYSTQEEALKGHQKAIKFVMNKTSVG